MTSSEAGTLRLPHQTRKSETSPVGDASTRAQIDDLRRAGVLARVAPVVDDWEWDVQGRAEIRRLEQKTQDQLQADPALVLGPESEGARWFTILPGFQRWRALMPSASALYCLQRPDHLDTPVELDEGTRKFFRHLRDSMGVRARAASMRQVVTEHVEAATPARPLRWVSLACGAALPVLDAAEAIRRSSGLSSEVTLVDLDLQALRFAATLAESAGVPHRELQRDLVRGLVASAAPLVDELGEGSADVVDLLGIFEYFGDAAASRMLTSAARLVRPGGLLVLANIRSDSPTWDFNQRGACWPRLVPRTMRQVVDLALGVGVQPSQVSVESTPEGVYTVVFIRM